MLQEVENKDLIQYEWATWAKDGKIIIQVLLSTYNIWRYRHPSVRPNMTAYDLFRKIHRYKK